MKIADQHLTGFEVMNNDLPYLKEMLVQKTGTGLGSWSHGATFLSSCPLLRLGMHIMNGKRVTYSVF